MSEMTVVAPVDRWVPSRAGLIALWRYWDETFTFHRGRLLLRGPNGSGKSMALELLLPFLLDGDSSPSRLTSASRSRGRLFDRVMTGTDEASRTGFAWVEFRRGDDTFTVGARLRASRATAKVDVDLFTTTRTVGDDLHLLDATRTPLSKRALVEAIGATGRVHGSADEHRAAVRETLFPGFDADRYQSVIGALLALRKEKLSQNLDLDKLSEVLSDALPPIDEHDIAAVAEGFERLDRRRAELAALGRELDEVHQLARRQRDYALAVAVGVARSVRSAETRRDDVTRRERTATEALGEARQGEQAAAAERASCTARADDVTVEIDALKDSPAYREGAHLPELQRGAERAREAATRAVAAEAARRSQLAEAEAEAEQAGAERDDAAANLERAERELREAAEAVGGGGAIDDAALIAEPDEAERFVRAWERSRRALVAEVRVALDQHDDAVSRRANLEGRVADDETAVDRRAAELDEATAAAGAARAAYRDAVVEWAGVSQWVGPERLASAVLPVADDPGAVRAALAAILADLRAEEATARERLAALRLAATDERDRLVAERRRWEQPDVAEPDSPAWRTDRADRPGAPFWRLVDVADGVAQTAIDGLEAAMAAAGLLDAWVQPDGGVDLGPERADLVLTASPADGPTLASLLVPAADAADRGVPAPVVASVLASVVLDDADHGAVALCTDGGFRLGSAVGRTNPQPATLLGAAARERHRQVRLAEIDAGLRDVDHRLAEADREGEVLDRRRAAVDAELAAQPSGEAVADADASVVRAGALLEGDRARLAADRDALRQAEDAVRHALRALTAVAARHGLPADRAGLADVEFGLTRTVEAAGVWARRRREEGRAERDAARAAARVEASAAQLVEAASARDESERAADDAERRLAVLRSAVGTAYDEILRRIADLDGERTQLRERARHLEQEEMTLAREVGKLGEQVAAATRERELADEQRAGSHRRFGAAVRDLAVDAAIDVAAAMDTATDILAAARAVAAANEKVDSDEQVVERLSDRVNERVFQARAALGGHVDLDRELTGDGWWVLRTMTTGIRRPVAELARALAAQLEEGERELAADEERLFEQTLAGSVRRALADRIRQANALVDGINDQLAAVRTDAGGVQVRLRWDVDPEQPAAVRAARALLLRDPADLSEAERASLQEFVRARVDQARLELEPHAPWEARLRETLDYRAWHRFALQLAHRDWDGFQPATARRLHKLSTGERSIALHLPMIASVAAHYEGDDGRPSACPRLILLDELFAGVDAVNRAKLFGTFTSWDLDAVLTSDHEWCQYATLDGIAIHHLHPPRGDEPVTSTRFTWDGARREIDPAA